MSAARNGKGPARAAPKPPQQAPIPPDTLLVMSVDGGDTFTAAMAEGCTISRFAWPTILRLVADRLEANALK